MRRDGVVQYVLGDHLRSTTLVLDQNGAKVDEIRYYPYGAERWPLDGTFPTDYRFTGQKYEAGVGGLYQMGARWYDSELGRWISPDNIIPDLANPQSLNRLAYVYNNPLGYIDSSGHAGQPWWKRLVNKIFDYWAPWTAPAITGPRVSPPTSDDMTSWLVSQMNTNAQAEVTQLIRENWVHAWPHQNAAALKAWTSLVRAGAIWDFKTDILYYDPDIENVQLGGHELNYQAVANIHFGFVGRAAGFGSEVLRAGAGIAQFMDWYDKDPSAIGPLGYETENGVLRTYFDQPFDSWCVVFGIYLYEMYRDELTEETFEQALQEFIEIYGEAPPLEQGGRDR
jgi:RHS repeat-associated protein